MRVALTIDTEHPDRPTDDPIGNAVRILDILKANAVFATFFIQGKWAQAYPHLVERIADDGHLVGAHSHSHCVFTYLNDEGIADDLACVRKVLDPRYPTSGWFRLPAAGGSGDSRVLAGLHKANYRHIGWTCGGNDWEAGISVSAVADPIIRWIEANQLSVVDLHSWPDPTPRAVEAILQCLSDRATFIRLDALRHDELPV
jgi:peptidoglycan/xylan/chitin deacetylase (PgdA/CDA1 family)